MSDYQAKAPFGFREPVTYPDSNMGVRSNMNEPPMEPKYEPGAFLSRLQAIEKDLQESVRRNEDNLSMLLIQMKSGSKFPEHFKELQHEFRSQIEPLQKEDHARFEVRLEACKLASGYIARLSGLMDELLKYLF